MSPSIFGSSWMVKEKVADIRDGVIELYDVAKEQAREDVLDFIEELKEADLISEVT